MFKKAELKATQGAPDYQKNQCQTILAPFYNTSRRGYIFITF